MHFARIRLQSQRILQRGVSEGEPGLRPFHANFYAAYVRDPDGNKLSAVCEAPEPAAE